VNRVASGADEGHDRAPRPACEHPICDVQLVKPRRLGIIDENEAPVYMIPCQGRSRWSSVSQDDIIVRLDPRIANVDPRRLEGQARLWCACRRIPNEDQNRIVCLAYLDFLFHYSAPILSRLIAPPPVPVPSSIWSIMRPIAHRLVVRFVHAPPSTRDVA